ncbi:unnamed protein product [Prunus armeniaca]|uniref:Uncharacterized protein n=1 Tax=Prunus armeniaca TaxID=36596 RepID=A0A6J5WVY2_PRUAR|nr:hypothetical protein GBA52_010628 [Prunus armeniaca]CAB4303852.1 unnamed protein product [Prunus armeniaca]
METLELLAIDSSLQAINNPELKEILAISLLLAQILELIAALLLLQSSAKPQYKFVDFFKANKVSKKRSWLLASAVGYWFSFLPC